MRNPSHGDIMPSIERALTEVNERGEILKAKTDSLHELNNLKPAYEVDSELYYCGKL
jgi:hypothetical protein